MAFRDCVEAAVKAGKITRDQAEDLYSRQGDATEQFLLDAQHSPESAARMGVELSLERAKQRVRLQKYQAALQAIRNADNAGKVLNYQGGATRGVRTILTRDSRGRATWNNIEVQARSILGQAHATMAKGLSELRTRWLGFSRDKVMLKNAVRELFAETTGDARAGAFARAFGTAAENLRLRFNRAGGAIPRLKDWGMPQSHDSVLVGRATEGEWVDFTLGHLDPERMTDVTTGQPFTLPALRATLQQVYQTIKTNGVADMVPGAGGAGKKLANRRQEARFLVFKDADSWLAYQERFGSPNLFGTMMDHLHAMSKDVALLEGLGPNPQGGFRYLMDLARKAEDRPLARQANEAVFRLVNGTSDANRSPFVANLFGAIRNWNVASKLGAASLSAISDMGFIRQTARWNGMSFARVFRRYLAQLNPANEGDRILATRMGITALSWSEAYSNIGRFSDVGGGGAGFVGRAADVGAKFAEATLRASGLNAMTDAGKRAFALEWGANLAEAFGHEELERVPGLFGDSLRRRISQEDWKLLRTTRTVDHDGAKFFAVDELMDRVDLPTSQKQKLAGLVQGILNEELLYAVPEPDALARVITTGGGQARGTIAGEVSRNILQFKSFPIAVLSLHAQRAITAAQNRGTWAGVNYAAQAIIATTTLGFVAMQAKQIAKGKDPRDFDDPAAWAAAFVQGGGLGIYGDFLFADANRFGQGPVSTMLGPTAGLLDDVTKLTLGNIQELVKGEDTHLASDVVGFGSRYMPGGNLWYSRLVLEREVFDQLALAADPIGARKRFQRAEKRARDESSGFWWRPGQQAPDRAPETAE
jgi:hypothetical protein